MRSTIAITALSVLTASTYATPTLRQPPTKVLQERDIFDAASSAAQNVINSFTSAFPEATAAIAGILPGFENTPSVKDAINQFNLTDEKIAQLPVNVLNLPGYANFTNNRWNLLFHGLVYKTPQTSGPALEEAADGFVPDVEVKNLDPKEKANALNLTAALYSLPVEGAKLKFDLTQNGKKRYAFTFPVKSDSRGEYNKFIQLNPNVVPYSNQVQKLDVHINGTDTGNATAYLVPNEGVTIIADVDDILRITKIWIPEEGLNNTFVKDFVPWKNMPGVFAGWAQKFKDAHFHYLTTVPEPGTRIYEQFIYSNYPAGSFDTRPSNFTTLDQIFNIRDVLLRRVIETFPQRKFVLVGDVSNRDIMKGYPALAEEFAGRICILLRNTTATDKSLKFPYDTSGFKNLPNNTYMFFNTPDDIKNLDLENMNCRNDSIPQNVTFGYQNLPFGAGSTLTASFMNVMLGLGVFVVGAWFL